MVRFQNQPAERSKDSRGVPDAVIEGSFRLLIETKRDRKKLDKDQLKRHLSRLKQGSVTDRVLLVITPHRDEPAEIGELKDKLLIWKPFSELHQAIDELLDDAQEVVSDRETFLLRSLQAMLFQEKLLDSPLDVAVVAAREAWPEYQRFHAYVCQPDRSFQEVKYLSFYADGQIQPLVARIRESKLRVEFTPGMHKGELGHLVEEMLAETPRQEGLEYQVMFLSPPEASETIDLGQPIENDIKSKSGKNWAFTLSQRYVSLEQLKIAKTTSQLVEP